MNLTTTSTRNESAFVITVIAPHQSTTRPACRCAGRAVSYPAETHPMTAAEILAEVSLRG